MLQQYTQQYTSKHTSCSHHRAGWLVVVWCSAGLRPPIEPPYSCLPAHWLVCLPPSHPTAALLPAALLPTLAVGTGGPPEMFDADSKQSEFLRDAQCFLVEG